MYKLGYYDDDGEGGTSMITLKCCKTSAEAKTAYQNLTEQYNCTIWVLKFEKVDPKTL